ncbi:MAG TPA: hypothetical protein VEV85_07990, partial [Bryobacteraceae bacterium]|nr:hypothetical protein [Bryobacteraceae bacterium]
YTDWKNVYLREPTDKEQLHGKVPATQFGRMRPKLDIGIIAANSAQAKGRVERGNGTHQDRLIQKMGRQKIRTHEAAKPVSAGRIFSRSQRSFCAGASGTAGLSSQGAEGAGVGAGVSFGDRAHFQRLGNAV